MKIYKKIIKNFLKLPAEVRPLKIVEFLDIKKIKIADAANTKPQNVNFFFKFNSNSPEIKNAILSEINFALNIVCPDLQITFDQLYGD